MTHDKLDQLRRLGELRAAGTITDTEFDDLKAKVLAAPDAEHAMGAGEGAAAPTATRYPHLPQYQLMTPRAPLPPGAGVRVYPLPLSEFDRAQVSPRWGPDPTGRHEWRWWGGTAWTDEVADDGVRSTDPMDR